MLMYMSKTLSWQQFWIDFWAWADDHGSGLTAVATVALVLAGVLTLFASATDSHKKSRPMVSARFSINENSPRVMMFLLKNYGPSRATNVSVTFTPPIQKEETTELVVNRYSSLIGVLNPGEEYENAWYMPDFTGGEFSGNRYGFPDQVTVTVNYHRFWWFKYRDVTKLDVNTHLNTSDHVSSDSLLGSMRSIANALKDA